ncbi:hypothetical protein [Roseateles sp. P5_D6]
MGLFVTALLFDHGRGQPQVATLPLRYDSLQPVLLPEWKWGQLTPAVAAYAIDRLGPSASVQVRFFATPDVPRTLEIRALAEAPGRGPMPFAPLAGDMAPQTVTFDAHGESPWNSFSFDTGALRTGGVDCATLQWRWQARGHATAPWLDAGVTQQRLYALLSAPSSPWETMPADPGNPALPRTDMLDVACLWARGARDASQAAARITEAVNRLGGTTLTYDALVGAPHYTVLGVSRFLCDAFLERLRGGAGAGPLVNCSDCATIVSTFANLVGADLWQSKMGLVGPGFRLNPLLSIGSRTWSTLHGGFTFHEVAWTGNCTENDSVYDACCHLDGDLDPAAPPRLPLLPMGLRFGSPGDAGYRDRIALHDDREVCAPQPTLRVRRTVAVTRPAPPLPVLSALAARGAELPGRDSGYRFEGFRWFGGELGPDWLPLHAMSFNASQLRVHVATWRSMQSPEAMLRVEATEADSPARAQQAMLEVAAEVASPRLQPWQMSEGEESSDAELGLSLDNGALVLFTRGNLMLAVRSAGLQPLDARSAALQLDYWLVGADSASTPTAPVVAASGWRRWRQNADHERSQLAMVTPAHAAAWRPLS